MNYLTFKTFAWPSNPHTYRESYVREPQYYTQDGNTYFDGMGEMKRKITGSGVFSGENAYTEFKKLIDLFEQGEAGNLEHPVWGIRFCYLTGMELTQEPREDYVSYSFEFTGASTNGTVPK